MQKKNSLKRVKNVVFFLFCILVHRPMGGYIPSAPLGTLLVLGLTTSVNTLHKIIPKISVLHCEVTMLIQQIRNAVVEVFVLIMKGRGTEHPMLQYFSTLMTTHLWKNSLILNSKVINIQQCCSTIVMKSW